MASAISNFDTDDNSDLIERIRNQIKMSLCSLETLTTEYSENEHVDNNQFDDLSIKDLLLELNEKL
jgi:hypothetical protein